MAKPSLSEWSFEALLIRVRDGDSSVRDELGRRCLQQVEQWTKSQRSQVEKAGARPSDLTQDSLLKAFQHLESFKGSTEKEWWAWLRRIVANEAVGTYRHSRRKQRDVLETIPLDSEDALSVKAPGATPSHVTAVQEEWRRLLMGLQQLAEHEPDQQRALTLCYLENQPRKDVAELMGRTVRSVEGLVARGGQALWRFMTDEPDSKDPHSTEAAAMFNEVDAAISRYLRLLEAGERVEVDAFVMQHPVCGRELRGILHSMERLRALDPARTS
ncbi:sigma-70 family RNA polymerase sigma factor [Myxococcus sp. K38C18041901]|uniref:sigma-70 family RNA polymerase sigma factor n=1 Tax=Myxococcus guangdongensis TaxID=2906760 RepID=UPI0020A700CB|nr:sigma-70 family RNA polymerase sigma factor [Myxococcus guangdongensis]MCP3062630.1 sigma-70 family RNA polymerase sigma factor [Myxococcus guangdongensis]